MKWISSTGGPCIIISVQDCKIWSGVGSKESALKSIYTEVEDFMDSSQCHYGLACEVENDIGIIKIGNHQNPIIVIGDEPAQMTTISNQDTFMVIKWFCGESEEDLESHLKMEELNSIDSWTPNFDVNFELGHYLLIDSSESGFDYDKTNVLEIQVVPGIYRVDTNLYSPDKKTSMNIHRFKLKAPHK